MGTSMRKLTNFPIWDVRTAVKENGPNQTQVSPDRQVDMDVITKNKINDSLPASLCTCRKAVLTIEAAAVLPFFVCFMVFILYFFRILHVQAGVGQALQYAGRKTAASYRVQEAETNEAGSAGILKAELYFREQLKKQNCPVQYIKHGRAGISLLQSSFTGNYIELKAVYQMKFPIRLIGDIQYRVAQGVKCRKWTGYQPGQDTEAEDDKWLYYTEYGTVYHASRSCTHLDLSIKGIPDTQVSGSRNHSGGKYHACEKCGSHVSGTGMVYITNYGDRYHSSLTCSGLKRSIFMIRKSKAAGKKMCKKCAGG